MTTEESSAQNTRPQPAPPRKGRGGLIALIVVILVVLGGGAAGYYYLLYLPSTPRAVLAEFYELDERGDADATYRFLSDKSRKLIAPQVWQLQYDGRAADLAQMSFEYDIGEPEFSGNTCRIPVTTTIRMRDPKQSLPPTVKPTSSDTLLLVKDKTGWKVGIFEQIVEQSVENMRRLGRTDREIQEAVEALNQELERRSAEAGP